MADKFKRFRKEYLKGVLDEAEVDPDPLKQFVVWLSQAGKAGVTEPNAAVLATATATGVPSARVILLKDVDTQGIIFFTSYLSRKAQEIAANTNVALVSYWEELERQVRIEGKISQTDRATSEKYFASRPRGSQLSASISPQSERVPSRKELEQRLETLDKKLFNQPVPCPATWGGYRIIPERFEFWQGRENKLHDRVLYSLKAGGGWEIWRLGP